MDNKLGCWWASEIKQNLNGCRLFIDKLDAIDKIIEEMKEQDYHLIETINSVTHPDNITLTEGTTGLRFKNGTNELLWVFAFIEVE
jgi:hypothetical protein